MARLFIAVDLPEGHQRSLSALRDGRLDARWTPEGQHHLTLRFIGEVDEDAVDAFAEGLGRLAAPAFSLEGRGLGVFPSRRNPRVLFAALDHPEALRGVQAQAEAMARALGCPPETRPFHPHVTLARLKHVRPPEVQAYLDAHSTFALPAFAVAHVHLYRSELRPGGAVHRRAATTLLSPPLPP